MKTCSKCYEQKPDAAFYFDGARVDGSRIRRAECKQCVIKKTAEFRQRTVRERNKAGRRYMRKLRLAALNHYGKSNPKCECCGESHIEFLAIDHIGGGGRKHRKVIGKGCSIYGWLKRNGYPTGFRILCHNCNTALGLYGYCPHRGGSKWEVGEKPRYNSRSRLLTLGDKTLSVTEWAKLLGVKRSSLSLRLSRGMDPQLALTKQWRCSPSRNAV